MIGRMSVARCCCEEEETDLAPYFGILDLEHRSFDGSGDVDYQQFGFTGFITIDGLVTDHEYRACYIFARPGAWPVLESFSRIEFRFQNGRHAVDPVGMAPLVPPYEARIHGTAVNIPFPFNMNDLLAVYPAENWPITVETDDFELQDVVFPVVQSVVVDVTDIVYEWRDLDLSTMAFILRPLWLPGPFPQPGQDPGISRYYLQQSVAPTGLFGIS